jgi:6,7-dimethyl-8-ribityllumazine synthase
VFVGRAAETAEDVGFGLEAVVEGLVCAALDGFQHAFERERGHGGDGRGEDLGTNHQVGGGDDFFGEAEAQSFGGGDDFGGEHELERGAAADEAGEALRAAVAGDEAELELGQAEAGLVAGEAEGAGEGELAAAAEGDAVDAGDDWLAAAFDLGEDLLAALGDAAAGGGVGVDEAADVGPGGEGAVAGSGEQDDVDGVVRGEDGEDALELVEHGGVEGVEHVGAVEGDGGDGGLALEVEGGVGAGLGHGGDSFPGDLRPMADDTIEPMIKGITTVAAVASEDVFNQLGSLLGALGFEPGKGWSDTTGHGAAFLAPLGNLELVTGRAPAVPALLVEVTQLDAVHATVQGWMSERLSSDEVVKRLSVISLTHWNSRLFTVNLAPGLQVGFWESEDPLRGRPVAIEGDLSAAGKTFAIVVARWNAVITDRLLQGALDALLRSGCARTDIEIVRVPGAWEIPSAARSLAESHHFSAIITLGVLLRGETAHYEAIYTEVARGIGQSQQETGVPHAFGVLTCETLEQALDRAGLKAGNKGFEAAIAAIEMASIQQKLASGSHKTAERLS